MLANEVIVTKILFKIIAIIERLPNMNRNTAKTVSILTSYQTNLIVDLLSCGREGRLCLYSMRKLLMTTKNYGVACAM